MKKTLFVLAILGIYSFILPAHAELDDTQVLHQEDAAFFHTILKDGDQYYLNSLDVTRLRCHFVKAWPYGTWGLYMETKAYPEGTMLNQAVANSRDECGSIMTELLKKINLAAAHHHYLRYLNTFQDGHWVELNETGFTVQ